MKSKDLKEIHTKTVVELKKLLKEAQDKFMTLKLDHQQNKLKNTRELFNVRKRIAVLKTIMNLKKSAVTKVMADKGGKE